MSDNINYNEEVCLGCGSVGLCRNEILNVKTGKSKGFIAACDECKLMHDYGEYTPDNDEG